MSPQDKAPRPRKQRKRLQDWRYKKHKNEDLRGLPREDYSAILGHDHEEKDEEKDEEG